MQISLPKNQFQQFFRAFWRLGMVFLVLLALGTQQAAAITQDTIDCSNAGRSCWWQPSASAQCSVSNSAAATAGNSDKSVYILGDSITVRTAPDYLSTFQQSGDSVTIDGSSGRTLTSPGTDGNMLSGNDAIVKDKSLIQQASAIVVALGTNGLGATVADATQTVDNTIKALRADNSNATIYWVDTFVLDRPDYNMNVIAPANQAIYNEATSQNYQVISWAKTVDPDVDPKNPSGNETDTNGYIDNSDGLGVHPTTTATTAGGVSGSSALATLVETAVDSGASSASASAAQQATGCCPSTGATVDFGTGTLPSSVPAPYNGIFTAAGNKFNVDPAFLTALFYAGEHASNFPDPPPPYGNGGPWASSGKPSPGGQDWPSGAGGARGPFQFEYPTWQKYKVDGDGNGTEDPYDLVDSAFSAANYLAALGAAGTTDQTKLYNAAYSYNGSGQMATDYATAVMGAYPKFGGVATSGGTTTSPTATSPIGSATTSGANDCSASASAGGGDGSAYQDPLRDIKGLTQGRIDQGNDFTGTGTVYAIGPGTITFIDPPGSGSGWPLDLRSGSEDDSNGTFITYQLTSGSAKNLYVYVAERCFPVSGLHVGETVDSTTPLCTMDDITPDIETGWAAGPTGSGAAAGPVYVPHVPDGTATDYGVNFAQFLTSFNAKPGVGPGASTGWPEVAGTLPSNWPTWQ